MFCYNWMRDKTILFYFHERVLEGKCIFFDGMAVKKVYNFQITPQDQEFGKFQQAIYQKSDWGFDQIKKALQEDYHVQIKSYYFNSPIRFYKFIKIKYLMLQHDESREDMLS